MFHFVFFFVFNPKTNARVNPTLQSSCKRGERRNARYPCPGLIPAVSGNTAKSLSHNTPSHTRGLRSEARVVHPHLATWASPGGGVEFPTDGLLATVVCL
uniref:(northern house mosquito) hypothetical protein n=1 Tax=Culex pipiens TaxID=7175 RepID=A0A8D8C5A3_CULPI